MGETRNITTINGSPGVSTKRSKIRKDVLKDNVELYSLMLPVFILIFIFCYIPIYGIVIAFQNYIGIPLSVMAWSGSD